MKTKDQQLLEEAYGAVNSSEDSSNLFRQLHLLLSKPQTYEDIKSIVEIVKQLEQHGLTINDIFERTRAYKE